MAQKVQITLVDDIDGSEADETVSFALDGTSYEVDLSAANADKLREALAGYVGAGRKLSKSGRAYKKTAVGASPREVRDWAKSAGHAVPDRGRIPADVQKAFDAAH
ncbi:MAG: histone-like nucleoid-structuring protein Lsr2 [Nocardioides sp.]